MNIDLLTALLEPLRSIALILLCLCMLSILVRILYYSRQRMWRKYRQEEFEHAYGELKRWQSDHPYVKIANARRGQELYSNYVYWYLQCAMHVQGFDPSDYV